MLLYTGFCGVNLSQVNCVEHNQYVNHDNARHASQKIFLKVSCSEIESDGTFKNSFFKSNALVT